MASIGCCLLLAGASIAGSAIAAPGETTHSSSIDWKDCSPDPSTQLKCANFSVPLDWSKPRDSQNQITLGMVMIPAVNQSGRIGYLFMNPGGPGSSAVEELSGSSSAGFWRSTKLHQYFDILGPDPRGVGTSSPVQCDPNTWNRRVPLFPQDDAEYAMMVDAYRAAGQKCAEKSGDLLNVVDTASAARDLEAVRLAVGGEAMNYIGMSYGTQLGAQYAELFPDNIRAMVLDGQLDHTQNEVYSLTTEVGGYEQTLNQFFTWCELNTTCALHNETELAARFSALIDRANASPIPAPSCLEESSSASPPTCYPNATGYEMLRSIQSMLIFPQSELGGTGWQGLSVALHEAMNLNDASQLSNSLVTDIVSGEYSYVAIICQDWSRTGWTSSDYVIKSLLGRIAAPHTRGQSEFWYLQSRCMDWPAPVTNQPHSIRPAFEKRQLKTPVLMINAFYDPETAYPWAVNLQREFGSGNAVLVSRNGSGHTSYYAFGKTHDVIDEYLIGLRVPAHAAVLES